MHFSEKEIDIIDRMISHYPQFKDILKARLTEETNDLIAGGGELRRGYCQALKDILFTLDTSTRLAKRTVAQPFLNSTP